MGLILKDLFLTVFFTLLISGTCVILLAWLPRAIYVRYNLIKILPLVVLAFSIIVCLYESFCFTGAMRINKYVDRAAIYVETLSARQGALSNSEITRIVEEEYPALSQYISTSGTSSEQNYFYTIKRNLRSYIWHRVAWMIGLLAAGAALLVWDAEQQSRRNRTVRNSYLDY